MKKIIMILAVKYLFLTITELPLYSQTPLITNKNQIKQSVRDEIVSTSNEFINLKNNVINSTTTLNNKINNLATQVANDTTTIKNDLINETQARINADNQLNSQIQILQNQVNNATSQFLLKGGDTTDGNYTFNGRIAVGSLGIWTSGGITSLGSINASQYLLNGNPISLGGGSGGFSYPLTTDYLHIGDTDAYGRKRLWFYDTNSVLKLGGAISDGDGLNAESEGIVVINNTQDKMARIKADRLGLTRSSDSSYYYFRIDPDKLFYKSTDTTQTRLFIDNNTGNVGIGKSNPTEKLDIDGNIKVNGKIYTQDWTEVPIATNVFTGHIYYKVIGDMTCLQYSITCNDIDNNCYNPPYLITNIPSNYSTNLPLLALNETNSIYKNEPSQPIYNWLFDFITMIYNNGNIYFQGSIDYNVEVDFNACFRNKL
jgi:hypothetical protein